MPRGTRCKDNGRYTYYGEAEREGGIYRVEGEKNNGFFGPNFDGYRIKVEPFKDAGAWYDGKDKGKKKKGKNNGPHMSWREWNYYQQLERLYKDSMRCTCHSPQQEPHVNVQLGACGPSSYCPIHGHGRGAAAHPGHCAVSIGNCGGAGLGRSVPLPPHDRRTHYNMGYDEGAVDGYDRGYRKGSNKGYENGYYEGEYKGYCEGLDHGYEEQESKMHFSRNVHFRSPLSRYH